LLKTYELATGSQKPLKKA
jgi:hypothetical protein